MAKVGGKLSVLLMEMVCIISMVVRFTFSASAKKKSLDKVAAKVNNIKSKEGEESGVDSGNALNQIIHRLFVRKKHT